MYVLSVGEQSMEEKVEVAARIVAWSAVVIAIALAYERWREHLAAKNRVLALGGLNGAEARAPTRR